MRILIIGGAGMLGRALARMLKHKGHAVTSFDVQPCPEPGIESIIGDIRAADAVTSACAGKDAVIHTASLINQRPGKPAIMTEVNVNGTRNVIAACQAQKVPRLLYTSSVDVVFDGTPIRDGDETLPYPTRHLDYYGETKMIAEQAIINANGVGGVATCALRAAGLYGEHDRHRFPNVLPLVIRTGKFTRIGDGTSKHNHVYVENTAHAFGLALERLSLTNPLAGQCYFITDYAAGNFFAFFEPFLQGLNIAYTTSSLPTGLAMVLAQVSERAFLLSPNKQKPPVLTRYAVAATSRDFWFNHRKAARDFGYAPVVSEQDAFERTLIWTREHLINQ